VIRTWGCEGGGATKRDLRSMHESSGRGRFEVNQKGGTRAEDVRKGLRRAERNWELRGERQCISTR